MGEVLLWPKQFLRQTQFDVPRPVGIGSTRRHHRRRHRRRPGRCRTPTHDDRQCGSLQHRPANRDGDVSKPEFRYVDRYPEMTFRALRTEALRGRTSRHGSRAEDWLMGGRSRYG